MDNTDKADEIREGEGPTLTGVAAFLEAARCSGDSYGPYQLGGGTEQGRDASTLRREIGPARR